MMRFFQRIFNRVSLLALLILVQILWLVGSVYSLTETYVYAEAIFTACSFLVCIWIINRPGKTETKLAWIVFAAVFPIVGWLIYLLTGGKGPTAGMRRRARRGALAIASRPHESGVLDEVKGERGAVEGPSEYLSRKGFPLFRAENALYYPSGEEALPEMLRAVRSAEKFVFLEYFIIAEGEMWQSLREALAERAAAGVEVRVMYDGVGSIRTLPHGHRKQLESLGIRTLVFNPARPIFSAVLNYRDHRKILVVDGRIAFTGGINLADEYINREKRFGYWKDNAVCITGAAVSTMTALFLEMWNCVSESDREIAPYFPTLPPPEPSDGFVQPYGDSPLDGEPIGESVYLDVISRAKRYVWFCTPYLVIDEALSATLVYAAARGVEVKIVTPGIPDKRAVYAVTRSYYPELLEGGVEIYEYTPGFIHGKCCLSDDRLATVGSVNLDYRSLGLHFENGCVFYGTEVASALHRDFSDIFAASRRILRPYGRGGVIGHIYSAILRLLAPLL